jgi:hypothetical protein
VRTREREEVERDGRMTPEELSRILELHKKWLLSEDGGMKANLKGANITRANLQWANLDYSSFPLWCGSFGMKVDERLVAQLAYHICRLEFDDTTGFKDKIKYMAEKFHRFEECGRFK